MRKWILMASATILFGVGVLAFLLFPRSGPDISAKQANETVISLYGGEVEQTIEEGDAYRVEFVRPDGRYLALVNRQNGQVETMELLHKTEAVKELTEHQAQEMALKNASGTIDGINYNKERNEYEVKVKEETQVSTVILSAETGEVRKISQEPIKAAPPAEEPEAEPERIITRDAAIKLAKKTLTGEVQEAEFVETGDGGYYLVEIENEQTDQEATIQIHAIRGDTMTVEWDD
ncbi:PepSY domain-containing protein [Planococcus sp. APC 3900]|uniref:PepSY domain-containing protein n=1 Tax=Planococcus sp. APC 3900 TaxID=3035191 RepID=UPI0025B61E30|nr:PepSY domain-containing protein [Planococcus sp. APC 3900]MDN3437568.1 PepSY domain-containing protein [Planococcus sp. APC 3900]